MSSPQDAKFQTQLITEPQGDQDALPGAIRLGLRCCAALLPS